MKKTLILLSLIVIGLFGTSCNQTEVIEPAPLTPLEDTTKYPLIVGFWQNVDHMNFPIDLEVREDSVFDTGVNAFDYVVTYINTDQVVAKCTIPDYINSHYYIRKILLTQDSILTINTTVVDFLGNATMVTVPSETHPMIKL